MSEIIQTNYLLIGYSVSSWFAAQAIREEDDSGRILAITEDDKAYSRPLLSYVLGNRSKDIAYFGEVVSHNPIEVWWGSSVINLDGVERWAELSDGRKVEFERALIATGAIPVFPPIRGASGEGIFTFTHIDDLERMSAYIHKENIENILVLGGGFIGLKTCEALIELGLNIQLVELAPRLLINMTDEKSSRHLEKALIKEGVDIILEDTVEHFEREGQKLRGCVLKSGRSISCRMAVVAIGVRPNVAWLKGSGVQVDRGILVNRFQETSCPGVFAAGDVTETMNMVTGERSVTAIWPEAVIQGKIAGKNMAGKRDVYPGSLPLNAVEVGETALISAGLVNPPGDDDCEILVCESEGSYQKLVLKENRIVGLVFVKNIEKAGIYIHLLRQRISIDAFRDKLLQPDFGIISLPSNFRKHMVEGAGIEV